MSLKINAKILRAIEDGDDKNLPAKTFLRGFIRSYAQYLKLNVNDVLNLFQEEVGSTRPPEVVTPEAGKDAGKESSVKPTIEKTFTSEGPVPGITSGNRMYTIIVGVVLLLLIIFVVKMIDKYQKEILDASQATTSDTIDPVIPSVEPIPPATTPGPAMSSPSSTSSTSTLLQTALPAKITTTTTLAATTTTTSTTRPTTTTSRTTTTTSTTLGAKNLEVIIEALSNVSVKFSFEIDKWTTIQMTTDQVHTLKGRAPLSMEFSDGAAVNLIVNGRVRGVPGSVGKPHKMTLQ